MAKRPPKGYRMTEYPLPHNFGFGCDLMGEDETKNTYILDLIRATEACTGAEAVEVNPRHPSFAEDGGAACFMGSIVPRMSVNFTISLTKLAIETDKMQQIAVRWMPIYTSFLSSLEAEDDKTAVQIEDILELTHNTDNKDVHPTHSTVNIVGLGNHPMSTVGYAEAFSDIGLTGNATIESVAFDEGLFWDAKQYYTNSGMLNKVTGKMNTVVITRDRPYKFGSNNFTNPIVKRMNSYTFCGILFHIPQGDTPGQYFTIAETTAIDHVHIRGFVRYDEWNPHFDQTST